MEWLVTRRGRMGAPRYFAAAPTRDQAKQIWWDDLKALVPAQAVADISESELRITTKRGRSLHVLGLDKPQRMEGRPWDGGVIDELANCRANIWAANIRPALSTRNREGWAWLIGVPDLDGPAQVEYEDMYFHALADTSGEWAAFSWPSADVMNPAEVESARKQLDPRIFDQEYLGKFILTGGRAFPDFEQKIHVRDIAYDPSLPICWSLDFNVNPMCSGVIQHVRGEVRVIDEIEIPDTVTPMAVKTFLARAEENRWDLSGLCVYGDASGNARKTAADQPGMTDWILVQNGLAGVPHRLKVPRSNPPLPDTRNAVNARIKSADGDVNLFIAPKCRRIIQDLRSALWPTPDDWRDNHCLAWLRYFVAWEYPVRTSAAPSQNQMAVL